MVVVSSFSKLFFISCVTHRNIIVPPVQAFFASGIPSISPQLMHNRLSSTAVATAATITPSDDDGSCKDESEDNVSSSPFRILCLHGKGGNGQEFLERLLPLRRLLDDRLADEKKRSEVISDDVSIKWEALTAPYQISGTDTYAWWTMSPGVRSFNADEYIGFDESASKVINAVFPNHDSSTTASKECSYDLILGHSQGAILLSALLATNIDLQRSNCSYILNGAAWPNPYDKALTSLSEEQNTTQHHEIMIKDTRMLFVMGKSDTINPIESAKQVHDCYQTAGVDVSIIYHEGGHSVPNGKDLDSVRAMEDVCDFILRTVSEKANRVDTMVKIEE